MLVHRLRRWFSIKPALGHNHCVCLVFTNKWTADQQTYSRDSQYIAEPLLGHAHPQKPGTRGEEQPTEETWNNQTELTFKCRLEIKIA